MSKLTSVLYPWNDAFSGMKKNDFLKYCPLIVILLTKCRLYCLKLIFGSFFGTMTYTKCNFCSHESIFQREIKLISYRSNFSHLTRKPALKFLKWLFFQNSLVMSWATSSGKMQVKKSELLRSKISYHTYFCLLFK